MSPAPTRRPAASDRAFAVGTGAFALLVTVIVLGLALVLAVSCRQSLARFGLSFWWTSTWDPVAGEFGALPFLWGTLYSSFLALAMALPVSLGVAIFLAELCPRALAPVLSFLTELLASIPSIVYGLWGLAVLVPATRWLALHMPKVLRHLALFKGPPVGIGMLSAAVVLAVMMMPFTAAVAREVLLAVPRTQREAALALGATRWEAIRVAVYGGRVGIFGAVMLGLGRALGETMAVAMLIGNSPTASLSLFQPQHTMAAVIANEFAEAADDLHLSALLEIGFVLLVVTLAVNVLSRLLIWSTTRPMAWTRPRAAA